MPTWLSIGTIGAIVICLNIILSAVQQVFTKLSLKEPGWLQSTSSFMLKVVQYMGSNPPNPPAPPPAA